MDPVNPESFEEWKSHPVTQRLMRMLTNDRENMKEGLVTNAFDNEVEVKGRCAAIAVILTIEYSDLFSQP
jgi:hypothetical protein